MFRRIIFALAATVVLHAGSAFALTDVQGSRDHPLFRRPPGYHIVGYFVGDHSVTVPVGEEFHSISGKQTDIAYRTEGRPLPVASLSLRFLESLEKAGGTLVFRENAGLGGRRIVGKLQRSGRDIWVMQDVLSLREFRIVLLETPSSRPSPVLPPVAYDRNAYETEAQALDLLHAVERSGMLEFPVKFVSGSNIPQTGYEPNFQKVAMLMEKAPSLKFRIETYADSDAKPVDQRAQLRDRSAALVDALAKVGADKKRLTAVATADAAKASPVPKGIVRLTSIESIQE